MTTSEVAADQRVAADITERILRRELWPGSPLRETELATRYEVGRNTVRSAIRLLAANGLAVHVRHRGAIVRPLTREGVADLFTFREVIECGAVRLACERRPPLDAFRTATARLAAAETDASPSDEPGSVLSRGLEADLAVHRELVALAGSERLDATYANLLAELRFCLAMLVTEMPIASDEHTPIVERIEAWDADGAAALLGAHLQDVLTFCLARLGAAE